MATTPRATQRFSVQTSASSSSPSSHLAVQHAALPDAGSAASYSFASGSDTLPPAFSSRRTSTSVLSSSASSSHQTALFSTPTGVNRNTFPTTSRTVSATSVGSSSIAGRIASFTSSTVDEGNTSYTSSINVARGSGPDILDRPRDKLRSSEINLSSLSFLFSEIVSYTQNRVTGITELEKRLSLIGYSIGQRILSLTLHRQEMTSNPKNPRRETRLLPVLLWIHTAFWKAAFGKPADSLERSTEEGRGDEYMISTNTPMFGRLIEVPRDMSSLSVEAITAGMVEAALDGLGFAARVTAHSVGTKEWPGRTTILIKLDRSVMEREEALASA
ncbi:Trafficking protein particle complex subunit 31 [Pseudozyma hubeiensis]|nr:Trafficking protein particle complex subunit 31 [Pseudozyma hubeiensis]